MIIIPHAKRRELLVFSDISYDEFGDNITDVDFLKKKINQPFIGEFNQGDWTIGTLRKDVHAEIGPYRLFTQHGLSSDGIVERTFIDFENTDDELMFKLKWL